MSFPEANMIKCDVIFQKTERGSAWRYAAVF